MQDKEKKKLYQKYFPFSCGIFKVPLPWKALN